MGQTKMKIISVDFQREFSAEGGLCYRPRPCVPFIKDLLVPFVRGRGHKVAEIISDYRLPRQGGGFHACVPGTWGYESEVPADVKDGRVWVKAFSSPVWVREHGGDPRREPGLPYPDHRAFSEWLKATVGTPEDDAEVILIGLTVDGCVLSALQELRYIGYRVRVLAEAVDTYSGDAGEKEFLLAKVIPYWGRPVAWGQLNP
ncbi:MAG: isochorismatase family protein [Acidobacteria bacterium]|nr:isochorismatase family protein [Acidobacteriota bacterium]